MKSEHRVSRTKIMRTVSVVCLLALIAGAGGLWGDLCKDKTMSGTSHIYNFYQLENNTVDVLLLGSSHVFLGVNTCMLFDEYGITAFDMGSGAQPIWISYYYLKEALKTQTPQIVLCDIFTMSRDDAQSEEAALRSLINMRPSLNKWNSIKASDYNKKYDSLGMFLNFPYTHTRYSELTNTDFLGCGKGNYNGYMPYFGVRPGKQYKLEIETVNRAAAATQSTRREPVTSLNEDYLREICELCTEKGIKLVFMNLPFFTLTEEMQEKYNYVEYLAEQYGAFYLDGNKLAKETGILWSEDMYDGGHLNYQGSLKYTKWLGEYLCANYDLEDHSNDPQYQHWADESAKLYHEAVLGNTLGQIDEADAYLRELQQNEQLVVAVTLAGKWEKSEETISELMRRLAPDWNGENALLVDEGTVILSADSTAADYCEHFDYGRVVLEFSQKAGKATVRSNENQNGYEGVKHGINVVVYDKVSEEVIDIAYFEIGKEGLARKH